ncbi:hypothetical protein [Photobacterium kishitanii]|uniref:hypothetical protein n=1 Tax=Photobacterium kishitanii TaxID=318456 RepID=UPI000D154901|nr:hypothetical protein [Photobacterium kishitanii]PSU14958.1 hypothetical protein CTM84_20820 [Photobacterium kishitanii]
MKWKIDDSNVNLDAGVKKQFHNNGTNIYDASMLAKVLPMKNFTIDTMGKGKFTSGVNVEFTYY